MALLEVRNLAINFVTDRGTVEAVRDVSFTLEPGQALGIVGESGCGKSITALAVMGLLPRNARIVRGEIRFKGENILERPQHERDRLRGAEMAIIFQDALASLNPVFTIGEQMRDIIRVRRKRKQRESATAGTEREIDEIIYLLRRVGISSPEKRLRQYVHELSGGMRQRAMMAMALCCRPELLIADEPTTALDVTTEAQILALMREIIAEMEMSLVLITHDLSLVAELCDRVMVMYRGISVEEANTHDLFARPLHPYTQGLLNSIVTLSTLRGALQPLRGSMPDIRESISGCQFHPRCPSAMPVCSEQIPLLEEVVVGHQCACFLHEPLEDSIRSKQRARKY